MIHFLMTISDDPLMWVRTESFICTLPKKYFVTLIITGIANENKNILYEDLNLSEKIKKERPFLKSCNLLFSSENYQTHPPVRWLIETKFENCIFIDCDMFVCSELYEFEKKIDYLGGVIAYDSPLSLDEWKELFFLFKIKFPNKIYLTNQTKKECPFYINFGFIIMNNEIKQKIKEKFWLNLEKIKKIKKFQKNYFLAQLALTITIYQLNINFKELPLRYNFPDYNNFENLYQNEFNNIKIFHSLNKKPDFFKLKDLENYKSNLSLKKNQKLSIILNKIIKQKFKYIL